MENKKENIWNLLWKSEHINWKRNKNKFEVGTALSPVLTSSALWIWTNCLSKNNLIYVKEEYPCICGTTSVLSLTGLENHHE